MPNGVSNGLWIHSSLPRNTFGIKKVCTDHLSIKKYLQKVFTFVRILGDFPLKNHFSNTSNKITQKMLLIKILKNCSGEILKETLILISFFLKKNHRIMSWATSKRFTEKKHSFFFSVTVEGELIKKIIAEFLKKNNLKSAGILITKSGTTKATLCSASW